MDRKCFEEALATLQGGKIPINMPDVAAHIKGTVKELYEYAEAVTECCFRLNNDNKVLRELARERTGLKGGENGSNTHSGTAGGASSTSA
jgi:hypothetical protein